MGHFWTFQIWTLEAPVDLASRQAFIVHSIEITTEMNIHL